MTQPDTHSNSASQNRSRAPGGFGQRWRRALARKFGAAVAQTSESAVSPTSSWRIVSTRLDDQQVGNVGNLRYNRLADLRYVRRRKISGLGFWLLSGGLLLLSAALAAAQPLNNLIFTAGTTIQDASHNNWSYILLGAPQSQLLAGKRFAIYGKTGFPTNAAAFTLRGTLFQQTDANAINNLLNQSVALNEDLNSLYNGLKTLLHDVPGATNLPLPQIVLTALQFSAVKPGLADSLQLFARQHPGLSLCLGQAFSEPITATTTYEVRDLNLVSGVAGEVVGRVTITPGLPVILPAPGAPFQVFTNAPSDHLRIRLRWGTTNTLRQLSLMQYGFNVWRIPIAAAIAAGYDHNPPATTDLTGNPNFKRVNVGPVMATHDYAPLAGIVGPDDPSDRTTFFVADNNGRALGSISPTYNLAGYQVPPFNDGDTFYYFVTARDILGRDGLVSLGNLATALRRLPPAAPTRPRVLDAVVPGTTNLERLLVSWQQNNNTNDFVSQYWVYRWPNPSMALTNDASPLSNRVAIAYQIANTNFNSAFDIPTNVYVAPGPGNFWYTIRSVSTNANQDYLLSPHTPPVSGVLRQRAAPPAPTGELVSSCGTPVVVFHGFNALANPKGPDTNNWNYRVTCQRRDSGIAWVQIVVNNPYPTNTQTYGPLYFPPDGSSLSFDVAVPAAVAAANFQATCFAGTYYGRVSQAAVCQNTNPVPAAQISEAFFSCGELLFTALSSSDPFLIAVNGQGLCYPALNPTPDASGILRMQFDPTIGHPPMLIQFETFTNTISPWNDLGVATADANGFYSIYWEPCLVGPLPPFRGCPVNIPDEGGCEQHVPRAGDGGAIAPIFIRFHTTPGTHEYRLYRSLNGGEATFIAQGAAVYNPNTEIVRSDDTMPPGAVRACYFVQALDENGNGSPLGFIGCRDIVPPKPPRPMMSEPVPIGDVNNPQMALNWFCPTSGVYRFEVRIRRGDQPPGGGLPTGVHAFNLVQRLAYPAKSGFYGLQSQRLAVDIFDESQFTPPVGPNFGPGPQFALTASVLTNVPYYVSAVAENAHGDFGDGSFTWKFIWKPAPTVQTVPWPARPLTPVTLFDDPTEAARQVNYSPRVAAVLFTNYLGGLGDFHYPVGIRFGEAYVVGEAAIPNIGNTNLASYLISASRAGSDPNSGVFRRYAPGSSQNGDPLLPIVVYRQQVANANYPHVSGNLTQVTPLLERVPWTYTFAPYREVTIPDRLVALDIGPQSASRSLLYLRDQQPVITGARYHYYAVRLNDQREVAETIDAGTVEIPLHP